MSASHDDKLDQMTAAYLEYGKPIIDQAHEENWGDDHNQGFCKACARNHQIVQYVVMDDKFLAVLSVMARLKEECDKYGLPLTLNGLLRHIYNNNEAVRGAQKSSIDTLKERGCALFEALDELDRYSSAEPDYPGSPCEQKVRAALQGFEHIAKESRHAATRKPEGSSS